MSKPDQPEQTPKKKETSHSINPDAAHKFLKKKKIKPHSSELTEGILKGDRVLLSQAITLIESENPEHQNFAQQIIENCLSHSGKSVRIGITGSPGVGKKYFYRIHRQTCHWIRSQTSCFSHRPIQSIESR